MSPRPLEMTAEPADFEVAPHEPQWLEVGNFSICTRCGWVSFGEEAQP